LLNGCARYLYPEAGLKDLNVRSRRRRCWASVSPSNMSVTATIANQLCGSRKASLISQITASKSLPTTQNLASSPNELLPAAVGSSLKSSRRASPGGTPAQQLHHSRSQERHFRPAANSATSIKIAVPQYAYHPDKLHRSALPVITGLGRPICRLNVRQLGKQSDLKVPDCSSCLRCCGSGLVSENWQTWRQRS